jgi:ribosomal protein S27AE
MSLIGRLFKKEDASPKQRTRICVECGMPVAEHKDWCSILRGQNAMKLGAAQPQD